VAGFVLRDSTSSKKSGGDSVVVVHDFNAVGISILPNEANSPLAVDADTVLTVSVSAELLKPI
jgi:hypothetical protein